MTVRELMDKLLETNDLNSEVSVYIDATRLQLSDRISSAECPDDYILDDFLPVTDVDVVNKKCLKGTDFAVDGKVILHVLDF